LLWFSAFASPRPVCHLARFLALGSILDEQKTIIGIRITFPLLYSFGDEKKNPESQSKLARYRGASFKRLEPADFSFVDRGNLPAAWARSGIVVSSASRNF
jgi:hypothetical protein